MTMMTQKRIIHKDGLGIVLLVCAALILMFCIGLYLGGLCFKNKFGHKFNDDLNKMLNDEPKQTQIKVDMVYPVCSVSNQANQANRVNIENWRDNDIN